MILVHKDFKVYRVKKATLVLRVLKAIKANLVLMVLTVRMVFHQLFLLKQLPVVIE